MLKLNFGGRKQVFRKVLCLGAHCDDIEIGCGGTILRLARENPGLEFTWVVFSSNPKRKREALKAAGLFLEGVRKRTVEVKSFRDGHFPFVGSRIKDYFEKLKRRISPDLIFTHYRDDLHQDHRLISDLTWNTWRDHMILEYEIPKYDGDLGSPNLFVDLDETLCARKIRAIFAAFGSQTNRVWFTEDTFRALLRIRGMESRALGGCAEGFYCRKALL